MSSLGQRINFKTGMTVNGDGYLRITAGEHRHEYAHRAYAERQLGRKLKPTEHVHHDCRNKMCWPPTDFHLVIMDKALHDGSHAYGNGSRRRGSR